MSIETIRMLLASVYGLTFRGVQQQVLGGTAAIPRRYKHKSEVDQEKVDAKRREIAEWNERIERNKK